MKRSTAACLLLICLFSSVNAAESTDRHAFAAAKADIESKLETGGDYADLSPGSKRDVRESLGRIDALFAKSDSVSGMEEHDRVALFNEQEKLNTLLTRADTDDQVVCQRVRPTGSRMASNKCMTRRERREAREGGIEWIRSLRPIGLNPGG